MIPVRTPYSTRRPCGEGGIGLWKWPTEPREGRREPRAGGRPCPHMAGQPPDRLLAPLAGSAVGVSRTPAVAGAEPASGPGRPVRPEHVDEGHGAVAELLVEATHERGREQRELGGPGGRVC